MRATGSCRAVYCMEECRRTRSIQYNSTKVTSMNSRLFHRGFNARREQSFDARPVHHYPSRADVERIMSAQNHSTHSATDHLQSARRFSCVRAENVANLLLSDCTIELLEPDVRVTSRFQLRIKRGGCTFCVLLKRTPHGWSRGPLAVGIYRQQAEQDDTVLVVLSNPVKEMRIAGSIPSGYLASFVF